MRILVVSQYFWPENFRINESVAELVGRGHSVTVLTGLPNYPDGRVFEAFKNDPSAFSSYGGADIVRVPLAPRGSGAARLAFNYLSFVVTASVVGAWKLRGRSFDVVYSYAPSPITAVLPAVLLRRLKRAPLLLSVQDLWPETLAAVGVLKSSKALGYVGKLVSFIYRRCDRILVQSRAFVPSIERYAPEASGRVRYMPGWAEGVFTSANNDATVAPEMAPYASTFNVVFAGNIGAAQDFPSILDAANRLKHLPDLRWLIVGDGRASDHVRSEVKRMGLERNFVLLGRHPLERMPSFFLAASALLVSLRPDPIFSMTVPSKVQSYLSAGVPLLAMLDGEGARIVDESGGGLVGPAGNGEALARNVERLISMSLDERRLMGERARDYGQREFDRDTLIDALETHFVDAITDNSL